jgi:hypothetical protein
VADAFPVVSRARDSGKEKDRGTKVSRKRGEVKQGILDRSTQAGRGGSVRICAAAVNVVGVLSFGESEGIDDESGLS